MRDLHINLSIVKFLTINSIEIHKKVNEHGYAKIIGIIAEDEEKNLMDKVMREKYAALSIKNEDKEEKNIFAGIIDKLEIQSTGGVKIAEIVLIGATRQMEGIREIHTYQDNNMQYENLLNEINKKHRDVVYLLNYGEGETIGNLIVQYKENDWEFIKRLASHFNQTIIPNYEETGIRYAFGLGIYGKEHILDEVSYKMSNNKEEFFLKRDNGVQGVLAQDFIFYKVESRDYIELGEKVSFKGQVLYVYEVFSSIVGGELIHTYILRPEAGFRVELINNTKIIGASLNATIIEVKNDTVKVCVNEDKNQDKETAKWFVYSTVYSSPDGTGWYCMPEEGDRVRLYFPSEREEEGYIISSINFGNTENNTDDSISRSNPDNKSISNKFHKQIKFTPTAIMLTNNKGMSIVIDDDKGIGILCNKKIEILAQDELSVVSLNAKVNVEASELIELRQGNSKIVMKDGVTIEGAKLNVQ